MSVKLEQRADHLRLCVTARPEKTQYITPASDSVQDMQTAGTQLLGLLIAQAYIDGMTTIAVGCSGPDATTYLRYSRQVDGSEQSWDMIPPPPEVYTALAQVVERTMAPLPGPTPHGLLHVELNGTPVQVRVEIRSTTDIVLSWQRSGKVE